MSVLNDLQDAIARAEEAEDIIETLTSRLTDWYTMRAAIQKAARDIIEGQKLITRIEQFTGFDDSE